MKNTKIDKKIHTQLSVLIYLFNFVVVVVIYVTVSPIRSTMLKLQDTWIKFIIIIIIIIIIIVVIIIIIII